MNKNDLPLFRIKWTETTCYAAAKECVTLKEFSTKYPSACVRAREKGWIQNYTWLKKIIRHPRGYWKDFNRCYNIAKQYTSKKDFRESNPDCYRASIDYGFIKDFTWLRDQRIDFYNGKIDTIYVYEFLNENSAYIGRTLSRRIKERDWEHIYIENDTVSRFAKKHSISVPKMKILETELTLDESVIKEGEWIEAYREKGWNILNRIKAGGLGKIGKCKAKYTYEYCLSLAKQCKTLYEFRKLEKGTPYIIAREHKWTDEYTWLVRQIKEIGYWTEERCKESALQCKTRSEFQKKYVSAYNTARKNKWLDSYNWFQNGHKLNCKKDA